MGRHRTDPMGLARLLIAGLAVLVVLVLIVVGVISLIGSLNSDGPSAESSAGAAAPTSAAPAPSEPPGPSEPRPLPTSAESPTVFVECRADRCPLFVRVTGGDIVEDRDLSRGQQAVFSQESLDVVLADASTVYVEVNGEPRPPGRPGERQTFTAER
ncbi:hypothetical protein [Sphaerisporangium sp. TRM90804]|uniref:hypothetical protein n=1 Tax=Sphaerisporangium sp. TRM90804 TaxID=3031113 RepID=UPI002446DEF6|nr:hypothetical protein [Sphaerisporangium sp. TRM90804]MDH2426647.1 hypothetical protein [Sphaerisporangium sp. TRM90804]